jgi:hypothetical protein
MKGKGSFVPARSERIFVFPDVSGQPGLIMRFPAWWNRGEFFKLYTHREIDTGNPIDANFALLLTSAEAKIWNKKCVEQYTSSPIDSETKVREDMNKLDAVLKNARWVIVESYEWESGLD